MKTDTHEIKTLCRNITSKLMLNVKTKQDKEYSKINSTMTRAIDTESIIAKSILIDDTLSLFTIELAKRRCH